MLYRLARFFFADRTLYLMKFDLLRLRARMNHWRKRNLNPAYTQLQFGCGPHKLKNWLNVDVSGSDFDIDLAYGQLPWQDNCFDAIVGRHVIEHLDLFVELLPFLDEVQRVLKRDGELWLSCPDMAKTADSYVQHKMQDMLDERQARWPDYVLGYHPSLDKVPNGRRYATMRQTMPASFLANDLYHQWGQHKNLFDFDLLHWMLSETGFREIEEVTEADLLARFPEFPKRDDDAHSVYIRAKGN